MSERTVIVRLRLLVDEYRKNARDASRETAMIGKTGSESLSAMDGRAAQVGSSLTRNVTLPILGIGVAAGKMSLDFEKSFSRMVGLAGVGAGEVENLKDQVLELGPAVGKSPQELAEALYFIRSAGIDGAESMEVLEASAKGAAAGLGSTVAVADAVTSALGAYEDGMLTAAKATDVLVATAREGKVEASEIAPQLGRLLPIASELGVTFEQLGGFMAFFSRGGADASLAATQLNGVLSKMLEPGEEGAKALEAVQMNAGMLRAEIRDKGLLQTLIDLRARLEENGLGLQDFSRDQQFLQGALQATGMKADEARAVIDAVGDSAGATDQAFAAWAETAGFKNAAAFAKFQAALISLGDALVPMISTVIDQFGSLVDAVTGLPGPVLVAAGSLAAIAALAGPTMKAVLAYRALSVAIWTIGTRAGVSAVALTAMGAAAGAVGVLIAGAVVSMAMWNYAVERQNKGVKSMFGDWGSQVERGTKNFADATETSRNLHSEIERIDDKIRGSKAPWDADYRKGLKTGKEEMERLAGSVDANIDKAKQLATEMGISVSKAYDIVAGNKDIANAVDDTTGEFDAQAAAVVAATGALQGYDDQLHAMFDPLFKMQDALLDEVEAHVKLNDARREHGRTSAEAMTAERDLARAILDTDSAALQLAKSVAEGKVTWEDAVAQLDSWVEHGRLTRGEADRIAESLVTARGMGDAFAKTYSARATLDTSDVYAQFANMRALVASNPIFTLLVNPLLYEGPARAGGGRMMANEWTLVGEQGPELVHFDRAGEVYTASETKGMFSGVPAGSTSMTVGGATTIVQYNMPIQCFGTATRQDAQELVNGLRQYQRDNGPIPIAVTG